MSLLDRLKPQPKWKHPDPEIRAAAVTELDDADELRAIVREDAEPSVRRAAVKRLGDAEFLGRVARDDSDERVRAEAAASLVEIASAADEAAAGTAIAHLDDQKSLGAVAKASPHPDVRRAAVGRLTEPRVLGAVARQAADMQTAMQALESLADADELADAAINSEHKDVALAAIERVADSAPGVRERFQTIGTRTKHKAVGRRATALVQALDEAEAARQAAVEAFHQKQVTLCEAAEAAARQTEAGAVEAALTAAEGGWQALGPEVAADLAARFAAAAGEARQALARLRETAAEAERQTAAIAAERDARAALCERAEAIDPAAPDALEGLAAIRAEWQALAAPAVLAADEADQLAVRLDRAGAALDARRRQVEAAEAGRARLEALGVEAETLAGSEDPAAIAARWPELAAEWQGLEAGSGGLVDEAVKARFEAARARLASRDADAQRQQEQSQKDNLARLTQLCQHLEARAGAEDLKLREAERGLRNVRTAVETPPLARSKDADEVLERLKALQAALTPRVRELRELDDWKRFANASAQEELIGQVEALKTEADLEKAAAALRDLHTRWRDVAEAPRDQAEALWHRFKTASDEIRARCGDFFAQQAEERTRNLQVKETLCEKAEALANSTDWIKTAEELKRLQAEWKATGPVSRKHAKAVWKRFRAACDTFFTRRHADLAERKQMWSANLERKQALCIQAEALAESTDWETAAAEMRRLQAEWKTIGPVRKNKSEAIWQRFRGACDHFFDRYKHRHEIELGSKLSERETLVTDLEALAAADLASGVPDGLAERAAASWTQWSRLPALPRDALEPLAVRYQTAITRLVETHPDGFAGTPLDPEANRKKMDALCARVENCLAGEPEYAAPASSPTAILAARLREALAANTIGGRPSGRHAEEAKWRAAVDDVKDAQVAWRRLGPVPGDAGQELAERFQHACNRFFDQHRRRQAKRP